MTESNLRRRFHAALGEKAAPVHLESDTRLAVGREAETKQADTKWLLGLVGVLIGVAIVASLLAIGEYRQSQNRAGQAVTSAIASPPAGSQKYVVTATVLQVPGQLPRACFAMPASYPPIGCSGVAIRGLDMSSVRGLLRYSNGVSATPGLVRLVGTWDGDALTLTQPASYAPPSAASEIPGCALVPGQSTDDLIPPVIQRVMDDRVFLESNGIVVLEFYPCKGTVFLGIAVADQRSIDFLTNRYGHVEVGGWLQPLT
jgi:hypothetical protein